MSGTHPRPTHTHTHTHTGNISHADAVTLLITNSWISGCKTVLAINIYRVSSISDLHIDDGDEFIEPDSHICIAGSLSSYN